MDQQQATLFPERLDELVAGDALVRGIDGFVDQLDSITSFAPVLVAASSVYPKQR